ncbi:MAG TPA: proton-conducting transporter membrane subunit [Anaerolineae bacterium]|nr:proton-conducting transporter membrane subunit [Anaerolineae bacterium]
MAGPTSGHKAFGVILSVALYALLGYLRNSERSIEAAIKYLILTAVSTALMLFGMALIYAELGTMEFTRIASRLPALENVNSAWLSVGLGIFRLSAGGLSGER